MVKRFGPRVRRTRRPPDPEWLKFMSTDEKEALRLEEWMITSLADTGLSVRAVNCLEGREILTVEDLSQKTNEDLLGIVNFGKQTLDQCKRLMMNLGVPHKLK